MKRNALLTTIVLLLAPLAGVPPAAESASARLNILFMTADDMNHDSAGCYGCPIQGLTPNLDRLAAEGMRFQYAANAPLVAQREKWEEILLCKAEDGSDPQSQPKAKP